MALVWGVLGVALGAVGAVPGLWLARLARREALVSVAQGLAATLISFVGLTLCLAWGMPWAGSQGLVFGVGLVGSFLALWWGEAWMAWRWMRQKKVRG